MEEYETGRRYVQEYQERLRQILRESTQGVMQAAASGAFIISEKAAEALKTLRKAMEEAASAEEDPYDTTGFELAAVRKCISVLRECAKRDLELR